MTKTQTASERITEEVTSWPGVEAGIGQRASTASPSTATRSATSTATASPTSASRATSAAPP